MVVLLKREDLVKFIWLERVFLVNVDVALHWHAADENSASAGKALANKTAKFRFYGVSSHASGSPQNGRSALDGVEAMNNMVNMLREHTTESTRIHYVITREAMHQMLYQTLLKYTITLDTKKEMKFEIYLIELLMQPKVQLLELRQQWITR